VTDNAGENTISSLSLSLSALMAIFQVPWTLVSQYQNVSTPDFIGAKGDGGGGGDNWSYKTCKAPVKSSPPTDQHPVFLQAGCPSCSCRPTNSIGADSAGTSGSFALVFTEEPGQTSPFPRYLSGAYFHL